MYVPEESTEGCWFLEAFARYTDRQVEVYLDETERKPPPKILCLAIMVSDQLEGLVLDTSSLRESTCFDE
jgi:hypothetical protein